ncbi:DUF6542 domain-containing protein [Actinomadura kijaniata]|uniref:DUF6542 domain-containing protein n=1 Tax=Actinomadura kijaniata TaxID=46161 RepID=UPI0009FF4D88|nr:DUF6542 domain-containing protein [Actinomadura kijaniata]
MRRQRGAATPRTGGAVTLTGRGGIVVMFALTLLGALLARWTDLPLLAGAGFVAGCAAAALLTRPVDLLTLAVSPPLVFLLATLAAVVLTSLGDENLLTGSLVGLLTALSTTAPWLFAGTVLVLAVTAPRGMLAQVRELREKLAGMRLFMEEENEDPVRWDDTPRRATSRSRRRRRERPNHADVD